MINDKSFRKTKEYELMNKTARVTKTIAENVWISRKRQGLTQESLAYEANVGITTIRKIERFKDGTGKTDIISLSSIIRVAHALKLNIKELFENKKY